MSLLGQRNECSPLSDDSAQTDKISFREVTVGAIALPVTLFGVLGNLSLLYHYLLLHCTVGQVRPIDLILMHLTIANSLIIILPGVHQTIETLGLKNVLSDFGCKVLLYIHRVGRGMSFVTFCLLSVFQVIMISPKDSCWMGLKLKVQQFISVSVSLSWALSMILNLIFPMHLLQISSKRSMKNFTKKKSWGYCYVTYDEKINGPVYSALIALPEVVFSVLIVWASSFMILFLHRHKKRVQHIHGNHISSRSSVETRAIQRILVLVSSFVCFYTVSSLFSLLLALYHDTNEWLLSTTRIISLCFPTLSPFLVMRYDVTVFRLSLSLIMTKRSHGHSPKSSKHRFWKIIQWLTWACRFLQAHALNT